MLLHFWTFSWATFHRKTHAWCGLWRWLRHRAEATLSHLALLESRRSPGPLPKWMDSKHQLKVLPTHHCNMCTGDVHSEKTKSQSEQDHLIDGTDAIRGAHKSQNSCGKARRANPAQALWLWVSTCIDTRTVSCCISYLTSVENLHDLIQVSYYGGWSHSGPQHQHMSKVLWWCGVCM